MALLGREETGVIAEDEAALLRLLQPIAKLTTARQAVAGASETLEAFGGAGYVEDTGLPELLRDAQVLSIWEGTTNVLALDALGVLDAEEAQAAVAGEIRRCTASLRDPALRALGEEAHAALEGALAWCAAEHHDGSVHEAGARRLGLTLGRTLELSLLAAHAQWCLDAGRPPRAADAARLLARLGPDLVVDDAGVEEEAARLLATPPRP